MIRLRRIAFALAALAVAGLAAAFVLDRAAYDPEPWIADLDALERHMGVAYANLEWVVERRGLDVAALDRRTRSAIEGAGSRRMARKALAAFVAAFDDPHFRIERRPPRWLASILRLGKGGMAGAGPQGARGDGPSFPADASGEDVCRSFGYGDDGHDFELDTSAFPDWSPLPYDGAFPGGAFTLPDGRVGILRIAQFGEDRYLSQCAATWDAEAAKRPGLCSGECLERFRMRASDALARRLTGRIEALSAAGIEALVVDVTGNGGGSEWVDPVTRMFTDRPLRAMRVTGVRHPRAVAHATERLAAVRAALADSALSPGSRALLAEARGRLAAVLAETQAPCDRTPLWRGRDPGCTQTVTAPIYATGVFDHLPDNALADVPARDELYSPFGRDVPEGVWSGPLYVLADGGSASATEAFVAMLADNGAATVLGERTYGAGCGYTEGGLPIELPHSGLVVWMPDCARYRIDGTNEIEGIEPDIPLPWSDLKGADRARSLAEVLAAH